MSLKWLITLAIALMPIVGRAQTPIQLDDDDVQFQFAGVAMESAHTGSNIARSIKPSSKRLCGFAIRGNHRSHANPHVEWDLNIDQIVTPGRTAAGVSAGTFEVANHKRTPRSPITQLSFTLHGVADPIVAEIQGVPNAANGIVALIQSQPAARLFSEFQTDRYILISMKYADGSTDQLRLRGFSDKRPSAGRNNTYFDECLRGFKATVPGETITITH